MPIGPVLHALERQAEAQEEAEALRQEVERLRATVQALEADLRHVARRQRDVCAVHLSGCGYSRAVVSECEDAPLVEADE